MSLNLNHRHTSYNLENPDLIGAYDDAANMKDRATTMIYLLQNEFVAGDRTLDDSVIFSALESVRMELQDIESLLRHFVDSQNDQAQKNLDN